LTVLTINIAFITRILSQLGPLSGNFSPAPHPTGLKSRTLWLPNERNAALIFRLLRQKISGHYLEGRFLHM
jgi:hypothetical protein